MIFKSWKGDLTEVISKLQKVAIGSDPIQVIVLSDRIALGLPRDRHLACEVLKLYRPMKIQARLVAWCLKWLIKCGTHRVLGKRFQNEATSEITWLRNSTSVGFLGCNPSHGIRCVLLDRDEDGGLRVTKLAMGNHHESVDVEACQLEDLSGNYRGVPKLGGIERGSGWTALWTRYFATPGPRQMEAGAVVPLLTSWLSEEFVRLGSINWLIPVFEQAPTIFSGDLKELVVRRALVHGDFAPWNLRWEGDRLMAVDWERGLEEGIAGLDLGFGMLMQFRLVAGLGGEKLIDTILEKVKTPEMIRYLQKSGWKNPELLFTLVFLYDYSKTGRDVSEELEALRIRLVSQKIN